MILLESLNRKQPTKNIAGEQDDYSCFTGYIDLFLDILFFDILIHKSFNAFLCSFLKLFRIELDTADLRIRRK